MTDAYVVLLPQMGISVLSWIQLILSMNRYRGVFRFTWHDMWALLLFLQSGFVRWIAALALRSSSVALQIAAAFVGTAMTWASFVVVFNDDFVLPSRQQAVALGMSLLITTLWEVSNRLVFELGS
jgi:hypothetical protein